MNGSTTHSRGPAAVAAVLLGAKGSYINDFRRRVHRTRGVLSSLGLPVSSGAVRAFMILGTALAVAVMLVGIVWRPPRAGLRSMGIPLDAPDLVTLVSALATAGLILARRRHSATHATWAGVSPDVEIGLRCGPLGVDLGLALMLAVQNLRWHEPHNLLAATALMGTVVLAVLPTRSLLLNAAGAGSLVLAVVPCAMVIVPLLGPALGAGHALPSGRGAGGWIGIALLGLAAGPLSAGLYHLVAPAHALRTSGLVLDLAVKTGPLPIIAAAVTRIAEATPWAEAAPYVGLAVFFLGLLTLRNSFVRVTSPEGLGYALFLMRLAPGRVWALQGRALAMSVCLSCPATVALALWLVLGGWWHLALLLLALLAMEIGIETLVVQRSTAVLPASAMAQLPQRSKAGLAAALCGGVALTFAGVFTATGAHDVGAGPATWAAAGFVATAVALLALAVHDAPEWIRELSATETEES